MRNGPSHRWFHALVVTGAAITGCGGSTDDSATDASTDTSSPPDATLADATSVPVDGASYDADAGGLIIITSDAGVTSDAGDVRNDPRCCTITN